MSVDSCTDVYSDKVSRMNPGLTDLSFGCTRARKLVNYPL